MSQDVDSQAHIAYELIDESARKAVVIEFLTRSILDPGHARELGEQLRSLIRAELPRQFVIDFKNVRMLGSRAFGEIAAFARDVRAVGGRVTICRIPEMVKLGATLIGLEDQADFAPDRNAAIDGCREPVEPIFINEDQLQ
jgi:anti-anti-sigma regulatory factor